MHKLGRAAKALVLLLAAIPLAGVGNQSVGLAPSQLLLAAARPTTPQIHAAVTASPTTHKQASTGGTSSETRRLERAVADLGPDVSDLNDDELDELNDDLDQEIAEVQANLDDLDLELEANADDLDIIADRDGVEGSKELAAAESKLADLEADHRTLDRKLNDIERRAQVGVDPTSLIAEVRALGSGIEALKDGIRELERLINDAEDRATDDDDENVTNDEETNVETTP